MFLTKTFDRWLPFRLGCLQDLGTFVFENNPLREPPLEVPCSLSSYTNVYSMILDSGSVPRRAIFSLRETLRKPDGQATPSLSCGLINLTNPGYLPFQN